MSKNIQAQDAEKILIENIRLQAVKLAALFRDSNMPDDIKEAWVAVLPKMTPGQIDRLTNVLEAKYLDEQTGFIDEEFGEELKRLVDGFKN